MNKTETKLKQYCDKKKYFCRKLQTHTSTGQGTKQVSDFIIANNENIYFIECKQRKGSTFNFNELTQYGDMLLLQKRSKISKIYILINFYEYDKLIFMSFDTYLDIKNNSYFKNGKKKKSFCLQDINNKYIYTWKTLNL